MACVRGGWVGEGVFDDIYVDHKLVIERDSSFSIA